MGMATEEWRDKQSNSKFVNSKFKKPPLWGRFGERLYGRF
jgi:hypothetical protein